MSFFVVRLFSKLVLDAPKITANALQIIKSFCDDEVSDILIQFYAMLPVYSLCVRLSVSVCLYMCLCTHICTHLCVHVHLCVFLCVRICKVWCMRI